MAAQATLVEQNLDLGRWTRATRRPLPALGPLLARPYMGFRQERADFKQWLEPPEPTLTLIVSLQGSLRVDGTVLPRAWIAGLSAVPTLVEHGGTYEAIDLKLTPVTAHRLIEVPLCELAGETVELEHLFGGKDTAELLDRLLSAADWKTRFEALDAFIARRIPTQSATPRPESHAGVAWAWRELRATGGRARIEGLAARLGWSRSRLSREFRAQVGLPPKTIARVIRFADVRRRLEADPVRWADIAYDCGYSDQSHLIRDFRELAGTTPTDFLARRIAGGSVVGDGVTFVQDSQPEGA